MATGGHFNFQAPLKDEQGGVAANAWNNGQARRKEIESYDGFDWRYTCAVLVTMTLGITMLVFERGFLEGRGTGIVKDSKQDLNITTLRIIRYLILLAFAMVIGLLSWLLLMPNLRVYKDDKWCMIKSRATVFWSIMAFLVTNFGAILNVFESEDAFQWEKDHGKTVSPPAHYMILVFFVGALVVMDIFFVNVVVLPFVMVLARLPDVRLGTQDKILLRVPLSIERTFGKRNGEEVWKNASIGRKVWMLLLMVYKHIVDISAIITLWILIQFYKFLWWPWATKVWPTVSKGGSMLISVTQSVSAGVLFIAEWLRDLLVCKCMGSCTTNTTDGVRNHWAAMESHMIQLSEQRDIPRDTPPPISSRFASCCLKIVGFRPWVEKWAKKFWDDIKEEENFKHSSWVKASIFTSIILLFYFGLKLMALFRGAYDEIYEEHRDCALENSKVTDFFLRSAGYGETSSEPLDFDKIQEKGMSAFNPLGSPDLAGELAVLLDNTEGVKGQGCLEAEDPATEAVISAVVAFETKRSVTETVSPSKDFSSKSLGELLIVLDVILRNLNWAVWLGFIVGLIIGIHSLINIFEQYKRVSMALRKGNFDEIPDDIKGYMDYGPGSRNSGGYDPRWTKYLKFYPLSLMVFFTGMIVSTAVLQLVAFGGLISFVMALLASLISDGAVQRILSPVVIFLLALIVAWFFYNVLFPSLAQKFLLDEFVIQHELLFLFFSLVFTTVHLVLGILLAFGRLTLLLLTTLTMINRLDHSLFFSLKNLDVGHRSFIAMVLVNHVDEISKVCPKSSPGAPSDPSHSRRASAGPSEPTGQPGELHRTQGVHGSFESQWSQGPGSPGSQSHPRSTGGPGGHLATMQHRRSQEVTSPTRGQNGQAVSNPRHFKGQSGPQV